MIESLEGIDRSILLFINSHHVNGIDSIMYYASELWCSIPLFLFWLFHILKKYSIKKTAVIVGMIAVLIALTDQSSNMVKHRVKRYRPSHNTEIQQQLHYVNDYHGGQYGFFSSHAANMFGVALYLFLVFNKQSVLFRYSLFVWAFLIAYSRIYLGAHYPSDVFVGACDGLLIGYLIFKLTELIFKNKFNEQIAV